MRGHGAFVLMMAATFAGNAHADEPSPIVQFLRAADTNDFATIASLVKARDGGISGDALIEKISNCYLRAVYRNSELNDTVAAWMCAEGENNSRVVLGSVNGGPDFVSVTIDREDRNNRPAPPRTGSAFAKGKE